MKRSLAICGFGIQRRKPFGDPEKQTHCIYEAKEAADETGINLLRANTVNDDPKFIGAMTEAVEGVLNGHD